MPAAMATAVSFRFKLSQHIFMLRQLENFDVRTTKCTLSADRPMLEAEIASWRSSGWLIGLYLLGFLYDV